MSQITKYFLTFQKYTLIAKDDYLYINIKRFGMLSNTYHYFNSHKSDK